MDKFTVAEIHRNVSLEEEKVALFRFLERNRVEKLELIYVGIAPDKKAVEIIRVKGKSRAVYAVSADFGFFSYDGTSVYMFRRLFHHPLLHLRHNLLLYRLLVNLHLSL